MMTERLLIERAGAVAIIRLNRPDVGNAIDLPLARALSQALARCEEDLGIGCIVLAGAGRMFCAGGDVRQLHAAGEALPQLLRDLTDDLHDAQVRMAKMRKPVIAAVHGPVAGAGIGLALIADIVLAEPAAHFSLGYSAIGLSPDAGATWLLPRLIGLRRAQELLLTNRRVGAREAAAIGLITRVVEEGTLQAEVDALANTLANSSAPALAATKRLLLDGDGASLAQQLDAERDTIADLGGSIECREGLAAFNERRAPDFRSASRRSPEG